MTRPITAACFPTPGVILRVNDPAAQEPLRAFARYQAAAATAICHGLGTGSGDGVTASERAAVLTAAFEAAEDWRYRMAVTSPRADGRYGTAHAERFRELITDVSPNLFRIGEPERYREGATWNPTADTHTGGTETLASATMRHYAALAAGRFAGTASAEVTANSVTTADGRQVRGTAILRGSAACRAAAEIAARITARGGDASRIATTGDLIYIASAPRADCDATFRTAITLLASVHSTADDTMAAWRRAAWMLYQAPRRKRGTDAVIRVFLIAAGTCLLGRPPVLPHDIDLAAYVWPEAEFITRLEAAQQTPAAKPCLGAVPT